MEDNRPLQDRYKVHCFGCGAENAHGLRIKSRWEGFELVCSWKPRPFHIGHPGFVYGGIIASIVDCHSMWTAMATFAREAGQEIGEDFPPPAFVTANLNLNYLQPARISQSLDLRARVTDRSERRANVACSVWQDGIEVANATVVAVKVPAQP